MLDKPTVSALTSLEKPSFDEKALDVSASLNTAKTTLSEELTVKKEQLKQPITDLTVRGLYDRAGKYDALEEFVIAESKTANLPADMLQKIYSDVEEAKISGIEHRKDGDYFTDAELNSSVVKATANTLLGGAGRVPEIAGNLFNVGTEITQTLRHANVSQDQWNTFESVSQKSSIYQDAVHALRSEQDEGNKEILRKRVTENAPANYTPEEKALFEAPKLSGRAGKDGAVGKSAMERIATIANVNKMESAVTGYSKIVSDLVNTSRIDTMMLQSKGAWDDASDKFGTGIAGNIDAVTDLIMAAGDTIINNPAAVAQLVVQTAPDIVGAAKAFGPTLAANIGEKQSEARQIYRDTYGKEAVGEALHKLNAGAITAGLVDTFGDKLVGKGGINVAGVAAKAGLTTGSRLVDGFLKVGTKATQAGATGAVGEAVAEGGGSFLTQLAGTQDLDKVDGGSVYSEAVAGAAAGGTMAQITSALGSAGEVKIDVATKMAGRTAAKESQSISDLVSDIKNMDVKGASRVMTSILTSDSATDTQKATAIADMEKAYDSRATLTVIAHTLGVKDAEGTINEKELNLLTNIKSTLKDLDNEQEMVKHAKDAYRGTSVEAAYKTLTQPKVNEDGSSPDAELSRQAVNVIADEVNSPYSSISTAMARDILEKRVDILTPDQTANLQTYITTNEAMDGLGEQLSAASVRSEIIDGGRGNIGARTYVNAIISDLKHGNKDSAIALAQDLEAFAQRHTAKAVAMNAIIQSFDSKDPMPAAIQEQVMAPFESSLKGSKHQAFRKAVPSYARMIQPEAEMLSIVSAEMNARVANYTKTSDRASADTTSEAVESAQPGTPETTQTQESAVPEVSLPKGGIEGTSGTDVNEISSAGKDSEQPAVVTSNTPADNTPRGGVPAQPKKVQLQDLLKLPVEDALNIIEPTGKQPSADDAEPFELGNEELPDGAQAKFTIVAKDGSEVTIHESEQGFQATQNGEVVGYIENRPEEAATVIQMAKGYVRQGIGKHLIKEFLRKFPDAKAGSFTPDGRTAYAHALTELKAEQSNVLTDLQGDAETNLVSKFMSVKGSNPLATKPGLLDTLRKEGVSFESLKSVLPEGVTAVSPEEVDLMTRFLGFNETFRATIAEVIAPKDLAFAHQDAINYLRDNEGNIKQAVVDAMSLSAFNWLITKSGDSLEKTEEQLGGILDVSAKGHVFSNHTYNTVGLSGLPFPQEASSVGSEILSSLGLRVTDKNAPHTLESRLGISLGARALQVLAKVESVDGPIIKFVDVSPQDMNVAQLIERDYLSELDARAAIAVSGYEPTYKQQLKTIQVAYTQDADGYRTVAPAVQGMAIDPAKAAGSFLQTVFGNLTTLTEPTFEPVLSRDLPSKMKRTDRQISDKAKGILDKLNNTKTFIKTDMAKVVGYFGADSLADMFGFQKDLDSKIHKDALEAAKSKNNLIRRNVDKVVDFFQAYESREDFVDYNTPFYVQMETTSVNRAQVRQGIMNMQSDKTARHMAYQEDWKATYNIADVGQMTAFNLAVGQSVGISIDKKTVAESLDAVVEIFTEETVAKGVTAAIALLGDTATEAQMDDIKNAVKALNADAASLDGLLTYARYQSALQKGAPSFEAEIGIEYDGVTNGPMITLMQFATADSTWIENLSAGGIYFNSTLDSVVQAKRQGKLDVYEKVALLMARILDGVTEIKTTTKEGAPVLKIDGGFKTALNTLFGALTEIDEQSGNLVVTPDGRTVAKSIVTPKTYQASDTKTQEKLGQVVIVALRNHMGELQAIANDPATNRAKRISVLAESNSLFSALQELAPGLITVPVENGKKNYLKATIGSNKPFLYESTDSRRISMSFPDMLAATYGKMFTEAVNIVNKPTEDMTAKTVEITNIAVLLYEKARESLIQKAVAAKAVSTEGGALTKELTITELQAVEAQLKNMFPEVMTAMSGKQGTGVSLIKMNGQEAATPFRVEMPLAKTAAPSYDVRNLNAPKALAGTSNILSTPVAVSSPGVRGVVNNVLATDGAVALEGTAKSTDQVSLYDAHMSGALQGVENGKAWNRALYQTMLNHSIPVEVSKMVAKVLAGFEALGLELDLTAADIKKYSLYQYKDSRLSNEMVASFSASYANLANAMQDAKRTALTKNTVTINHYFAEGSAVTYVNGKEVDVAQLTVTDLTEDFVSALTDTVNTVKAAPVNTDLNVLDTVQSVTAAKSQPTKASVYDDSVVSPTLTDAFNKNANELTLIQALKVFDEVDKNSPTINAVHAIVQKLSEKLKSDIKVVRYEIGTTYTGDLAWLNNNADVIQYSRRSRGMYANSGITGGDPVVLLMGDSLPYSGVSKETLFHELIHGLFDQRVLDRSDSAIGVELQNLMETVRGQLANVAKQDPEAAVFIKLFHQFAPLANAREFLAWGLTNASFQSILEQINYVSVKELDGKLKITPRTVMSKLRDLVQKVLFSRDIKSTTNVPIDNALKALITIGLKTQEGLLGRSTLKNFSRQQGPDTQLHAVTKLTSEGLFKSMKHLGHVTTSAAQEAFLGDMLSTVVNSVLKPLSVNVTTTAVNENIGELTAHDRLEIYLADNAGATLSNLPPAHGFNKSMQETYVHGLYLAILEEGLQVGSPHLNAADAFFTKAKKALTYLDFMEDPLNLDPVAIELARGRYASVFDVVIASTQTITDTSSGLSHDVSKSDYLRNFLALAATNEQFRNALDTIAATPEQEAITLFDKLLQFVADIVAWVSDRTVGVNSNESTTANLDRLTKRLVGAEMASQSAAEKVLNGGITYTSMALGGAVSVMKMLISKIGSVPLLQESKIQAVRLISRTARVVGNNQTEYVFKAMGDAFGAISKGKQGVAGELVNELKGTTKDTAKVHSLLRVANHVLDRSRKEVIESVKAVIGKQFKRSLTKLEKTGITKMLLRTDVSALITHGYGLDDIADLLDNAQYLSQEVGKFEDSITNLVSPAVATFYLNQAEDLGFSMAHGYSSNSHTIPNAYGIARLWGTTKQVVPNADVLAQVTPLIDALASLRAVERSKANYHSRASKVAALIREEYSRTDGTNGVDNNGITFTLIQHEQLKAKALKDNFAGDPALMRKGYMPDISNPYKDIQVAPLGDSQEMAKRGYTQRSVLAKDPTDPNTEAMAMYVSDGGGYARYMRGAFSTTGTKTKGNKVSGKAEVALMIAQRAQYESALFDTRVSPQHLNSPAHMQAVFAPDGRVTGYRYVMAEATKDNLLERNDDFTEVLGKLAGSVYDKTVTKPHNHSVMDALAEQYELDKAAGRVGDYIRLSARSDDLELRELFALLPYETKEYVRQVFGTDSIPIRAEFLRIVFGYRAVTVASLWENGGVDNNVLQQTVKNMFDMLGQGNGVHLASQFERVVQDLVRVAKSNIVVRLGSVTLMNLVSNTYDLLIKGLPIREALTDQLVGYQKAIEYVRQGSRLSELDLLLQADHNPALRAQMVAERNQIKHMQSVNPARELIEAGLLQTIVLEINQDIDPFSASSKLADKFNAQLDKLPGDLKEAAKFTLMTKDSQSFEFMNRMVQFSDFAARYALYKNLTTRKNNPLDKSSAIQAVITQFVNYDLPTHRAIQYGNDIGLIWFSRYWLRIQKVIVNNFAENPGRVLTGLAFQHLIGTDLPDSGDSTMLSTGIFHPLGGPDRVIGGLIANPLLPSL